MIKIASIEFNDFEWGCCTTILDSVNKIQPMKRLETTSPTLTITIIWFCAHVTQTVKRHKIYLYAKCILMVNFEKP